MLFNKGTSIRVESPGNIAKTAGFLWLAFCSVADGSGNIKKPRCLEWNPLNSAYFSFKMLVKFAQLDIGNS